MVHLGIGGEHLINEWHLNAFFCGLQPQDRFVFCIRGLSITCDTVLIMYMFVFTGPDESDRIQIQCAVN